MIVLGVDPGSRVTGYGLIRIEPSGLEYLAHGVIRGGDKKTFSKRITEIGQGLKKIIEEFNPHTVVIEKIFLAKNADSAFKLGHARGVCMYEAVIAGLEVFEYSTREVKKGVTGSGAADKDHVQMVLAQVLGIREAMVLDASDALAMAYFHASRIDIERKLQRMKEL